MKGGSLFSREFSDANILEAAVDTNGFQGGDTGHGGETRIWLQDLGSTDMEVKPNGRGVIITFRGDAELRTLIRALYWMAWQLAEVSGYNRHPDFEGILERDLEEEPR
jgi:hypothetical protein